MKIKIAILILLVAGILAILFAQRFSSRTVSLSPDEIQVTSMVLQHMFVNARKWNIDIKIRFVKYLDYDVVPQKILDQLAKSNTNVVNDGTDDKYTRQLLKNNFPDGEIIKTSAINGRSGVGIRLKGVEPGWIVPQPRDYGGLLYSIDYIQVAKDTALVRCHVMWHMLAAQGYTYKLKKIGTGWIIIDWKQTWLS